VADSIAELGQGGHKTGTLWRDAFGFDHLDSPCIDFYATMGVVYEGREIIFPPAFQHFPNPPACISINDGVWDTRIAVFSNRTQRYECASSLLSLCRLAIVDMQAFDQTLAVTAIRGFAAVRPRRPPAR
jgi:hypothetical protein